VLLPVGILGLIFWSAVGVRQRHVESVTPASLTSFYARVLSIVSATLALLGGTLLVKAIVGFVNLEFSYRSLFAGASSALCSAGTPADQCPTPSALGGDLTPQRTSDLVLAITLIAVGLLGFALHRWLAHAVRSEVGGDPAWVRWGALVGFVALYGFAALFSLAAAVYGIVNWIVVPASSASFNAFNITAGLPFGEFVGTAAVFIPAWIVSLLLLMRRLRVRPLPPPSPATTAPPPHVSA